VVARAEASIEDDLLWLVAEHLDRTLRELHSFGGVGWVAALHEAIDDQSRGAPGEEHLVAVQGLAAILADDVSVRLEDRAHLLARRHALLLEDAAASLIEDLVGELDVVLELSAELAKLRLLERLGRIVLLEFLDGKVGGIDRILCD